MVLIEGERRTKKIFLPIKHHRHHGRLVKLTTPLHGRHVKISRQLLDHCVFCILFAVASGKADVSVEASWVVS